ncbi:hypothetical protein [Candidatus Ferrigenium straubiae]|jgi:tetratricopeptide (TPR) repeat protein|uniref:hypothetical protein n=1 Tax=Candidatus Ferrigenium straubiae TaxID=2919506 RepID=UPI003F4AED8F
MSRTIPDFCRLALLIVLSGCASAPDTRSARHKQALEWASQGERAYLNGNMEQSGRYYEKALQLNTGIENGSGIAANLLSLAQLHLERGEYDRAGAKLQLILDNRDHLFAADARADAAARSAQVALLSKQPGKAAESAQQAQALCKAAACALEAAITNLQARAAFALGQTQASADLASRAADIADKTQQPVELANAKRLLGEMRLHLGAAAEAMPLLENALLLDKQLGLPKKIAADLHLLADTQDMLGRRVEAESYRGRERAIRSALEKKAP